MTRQWTSQELSLLRANAHLGAETVASMLGRSVTAVTMQASKHRVSLRRSGETRGVVLGQPKGERWADQIRAGVPPERLAAIRRDVLNGQVDMATLEARAREAVHGKAKPICPSCGQRNVERAQTGLCSPCHWRELARAHRDEADRIEARRELDAARQEKSRTSRGI